MVVPTDLFDSIEIVPAFTHADKTEAKAHKSFRPTASRTCGTNSKNQKQDPTQIPCACKSPLEKIMEPDISIERKTGHFYFALTDRGQGQCFSALPPVQSHFPDP